MGLINKIRRKLKLPEPSQAREDGSIPRYEKIAVFGVAYVVAIGMWMLINLDNEYGMNLKIPLMYGDFPEGKAPVESLPEFVEASVSGEGWKLLSLFGSAPRVPVNVNEEDLVNLTQAVQNQLSGVSGLNVTRVRPPSVRIQLDERITRKVPVRPEIGIDFRRQFGPVGSTRIIPDSVSVSGARSLVEGIQHWPTRPRNFSDLNQSLDIRLALEPTNELISLSTNEVNFRLEVSEFTEGEMRVPVLLRGGDESLNYSLSPSSVMVRFDVPIGQYSAALDQLLFDAYVNFNEILEDETGFIEPNVIILEKDFEVRIRSVQPRRVSYFRIVQN